MTVGFQFAKYALPLIQGAPQLTDEAGVPKMAILDRVAVEKLCPPYETR